MLKLKGHIIVFIACFSYIILFYESLASNPLLIQQVQQYGLFEIEFTTGTNYDNPYVEVSLSAHVQGPEDQEFEIDGFWQGNNTWKLRIMPTAVGYWTYTTSSNDPDLDGLSGGFDCIVSSRPGILIVNPDYPYTFKLTEGEPFFWMGETNWCIMSNAVPFNDSTFHKYVTKRLQQKFNGIHFVLGTGGLPIGTPNPENEGGYLWISQENQEINPEFFVWVDKRIAYLDSVEMAIGFFLTWSQHFTTFTQEEFERFERYMIARYAGYPLLYWVIVGEFDEAGTVEAYNYQGQVIDDKDPYGHLISNHPNHDDSDNLGTNRIFVGQNWFSFIMQQLPQYPVNTPADEVHHYILADRIYNIPVVNAEFGYEDKDYYGKIMTADYVRKYAWSIITAGGFLTYGHNETIREVNLDALESDGTAYMGNLFDYFKEINWWEMNPDTQKVDNGFCLSRPSPEYIIYLPDSGIVNIDLAEDSLAFDVEWYNPTNGTYSKAQTIEGGAVQAYTSIYNNDAVLHLSPCSEPYIHVEPTSLYFEGAKGSGNLSDQAIVVTNSGGGMLSWQAGEEPDKLWMIVNNSSGGSGDHVIVTVDIGGISEGMYDGNVRISDPNAVNGAVDVPVTLNVIAPPDTFITVKKPNGGEIWEVDSLHDITWTSKNTSGYINIHYSTDNGSNWEQVITNSVDDGSYSWTVPDDPSDSCLIRLIDGQGELMDVSDSLFTIAEWLSADFGGEPTNGELPLTVNFTDLSTGTIDTWQWDFGDGGTGADQNPIHDYNSAGSYSVTLAISGPTGQDTETKVDYITVVENRLYLSGAALYYSENRPVSNAILDMTHDEGNIVDTTDADGLFIFESILDGNVTIVPSKENDEANAITGSDALLVLQYLAFMVTLTEDQQFAADVTQEGKVTGSDAQAILRYLAFYTDNNGSTGQWRFEPDTSTFLLYADTTVYFKSFLLGDVNGDWGDGSTADGIIGSGKQADTLDAVLKMSEINAFGKRDITIPLIVEELADTLHTLIMSIEYDPTLLRYRSIRNTKLTNNFMMAANGKDHGKVYIAMAGVKGVGKNGEILCLSFSVKDQASQITTTNVRITQAWINDLTVTKYENTKVYFIEKKFTDNPDQFNISQNYPNPFNPSTTISFHLPYQARVKIHIFNTLGQRIITILNNDMDAGVHNVTWNGVDEFDELLPSGIYFYQIELTENSKENGTSFNMTKKMFLLK